MDANSYSHFAYQNILDVYVTVDEKMDHVIEELSL